MKNSKKSEFLTNISNEIFYSLYSVQTGKYHCSENHTGHFSHVFFRFQDTVLHTYLSYLDDSRY
jgi:hypothetical protein